MSNNYETRTIEMEKPDGSLGLALVCDTGYDGKKVTKICELVEQGHAEKCGFKKNDRFVSINGTDTFDMSESELAEILGSAEPGEMLTCVVTDAEKVQESTHKAPTGSEATVGSLLAGSHVDEHKHKSVSEVLASASVKDQKLIADLKLAVYDISIPLTTREMRPGEVEGENYHFVTSEEFKRYIADGKMMEYGQKNGVYYGTLKLDQSLVKDTPPTEIAANDDDDEVSVGELMGREHAHSRKSVSQFLTEVSDPAHEKSIKQAKDMVYDLVTPYTTRPRREGEKEGLDYHFVDVATFQQLQKSQKFLEVGTKNGVYYGTPKVTKGDLKTKQSRRQTLLDAMEKAPVEPSVHEILEHSNSGSVLNGVDNGQHSASQFLSRINPEDPQLADVRKSVKEAIYDMTVPLTTRPQRADEQHGVHYNFVSRTQFEGYIHNNLMLEYGEKNGIYYGTMKLTKEEFDSHKEAKRRTTMQEALVQPGAITSSKPYVTLGDDDTWAQTLV